MCDFSGSKKSPCCGRVIMFYSTSAVQVQTLLPPVLWTMCSFKTLTKPLACNLMRLHRLRELWTEAQSVDGDGGMNNLGTKQTWIETIGNRITSTSSIPIWMEVLNCVVIVAETGGNHCNAGRDMNDQIWSHPTSANVFSIGTLRVNKVYTPVCFFHKGLLSPYLSWFIVVVMCTFWLLVATVQKCKLKEQSKTCDNLV
jgi:hypothetical protein